MAKKFPAIFVLLTFHLLGFSQGLSKTLRSHNWYLKEIPGKSLSLELQAFKAADHSSEAMFTSGKSKRIVISGSGKADSSWSYSLRGRYLSLFYRTADSSQKIIYDAAVSEKNNKIELKALAQTRSGSMNDVNPYNFLWLFKKRKSRDIYRYDNVIVYINNAGSGSRQRITGDFYKLQSGSIFVDTQRSASEHLAITGRDTIPVELREIPVLNISKLYHERRKLNYISGWGAGLSLLSALAVAPLISIEKSGFNSDRFLTVTAASLASATFFITVRVAFSHKKMRMNRKRSAWNL